MLILAFVLSLSVVVLGALGIVSPMMLLGVVRKFESPLGFTLRRLSASCWGVALFLSAPPSRVQEVVRIPGILIFVMGIITPFFGIERFRRLLNWWSERGPVFMRVWAGFALGFGFFLAYAVMP